MLAFIWDYGFELRSSAFTQEQSNPKRGFLFLLSFPSFFFFFWLEDNQFFWEFKRKAPRARKWENSAATRKRRTGKKRRNGHLSQHRGQTRGRQAVTWHKIGVFLGSYMHALCSWKSFVDPQMWVCSTLARGQRIRVDFLLFQSCWQPVWPHTLT